MDFIPDWKNIREGEGKRKKRLKPRGNGDELAVLRRFGKPCSVRWTQEREREKKRPQTD